MTFETQTGFKSGTHWVPQGSPTPVTPTPQNTCSKLVCDTAYLPQTRRFYAQYTVGNAALGIDPIFPS